MMIETIVGLVGVICWFGLTPLKPRDGSSTKWADIYRDRMIQKYQLDRRKRWLYRRWWNFADSVGKPIAIAAAVVLPTAILIGIALWVRH